MRTDGRTLIEGFDYGAGDYFLKTAVASSADCENFCLSTDHEIDVV